MKRAWQSLTAPFRDGDRICWPLLAIFVLINGIVLYNAIYHLPDVQYDSSGHLANIRVIASGHLPSAQESLEYFSAPLAYLLPALILRISGLPLLQVAKIAQMIDLLLSLALTYTLLKIADELFPQRVGPRLIALGLLGMLPVYYRTFAYVRGEPYVAWLTLLAAYQAIRLFGRGQGGWLRASLLGLTLGLDMLARQWAFFFFPALFIYAGLCIWAEPARIRRIFGQLILAGLVAALVGGWFYVSLYERFGSLTAFNRTPGSQLLANQPADFYSGTGNGYLFSKPVRPLMSNQVGPILYADTWGDYWGYFLIEGIDSHTHRYVEGIYFERDVVSPKHAGLLTNYDSFGSYLGHVNLVSLLPSSVLLAGLIFGVWEAIRSLRAATRRLPVQGSVLPALALVFTLAGYFWFLVTYPSIEAGGTTIKASYVLQVYPLFALLAANLFEKVSFLRSKQKWLWALALVFVYDFPAFITQYFLRN